MIIKKMLQWDLKRSSTCIRETETYKQLETLKKDI